MIIYRLKFCKLDGVMKVRFATNIDGYLLKFLFLFELAYFYSAFLILSYQNASEEFGLNFTINFSSFSDKIYF